MSTQPYQPGKMFGVTHAQDGTAIVRVPRSIKVGIGLPQGTAVHGYVRRDGKFVVRVGSGKDARETAHEAVEDAKKAYWAAVKTAGKRKYPEKLPYFIFTRQAPDGNLYTDWDLTAKHGPTPTEIGIVFTDDSPLDGAFEMWTAAELKCKGDGYSAERVLSLATTPEHKKLADEAKAQGKRVFPIIGGCREMGCPFAGKECKPHARLRFQLLSSLALGSEARFDTTGFTSVAWLSGSLHKLRTISGHGNPERGHVAGVPLKLMLRPYKTSHEGKSAIAYGTWIDLTGEDVVALQQQMVDAVSKFMALEPGPMPKLLTAGDAPPLPAEDTESFAATPGESQAMHAEFYAEGEPIDAEVVENSVKPLDELIPPAEAGPLYAALGRKGQDRQMVDAYVAEQMGAGRTIPEVLELLRGFLAAKADPPNPDAEPVSDTPPWDESLSEDEQQKRKFERELAEAAEAERKAKGGKQLFDYKK